MENKITGREIAKFARLSEGYHLYLDNNVRILAIKYGNDYHFIPPLNAGEMTCIKRTEARNLMDAIREYAILYELKDPNKFIGDI